MGAKLWVEKAEIELTGGAELVFGNWTVAFEGDRMIVTHGDGPKRYEFLDVSAGWIEGVDNVGDKHPIYNGGVRIG